MGIATNEPLMKSSALLPLSWTKVLSEVMNFKYGISGHWKRGKKRKSKSMKSMHVVLLQITYKRRIALQSCVSCVWL